MSTSKPLDTGMKHLKESISPTSWMFHSLVLIAVFLVLLRPSVKEFLIFAGVDYISYLFFAKLLDAGVLYWHLPESRWFFDGLSEERFASFGIDQQKRCVQAMFRYPYRRAVHGFLISIFKVSPAVFVMVFVWEHAISNQAQFALIATVAFFSMTYFADAIYIESHIFLSNTLRTLHERLDLRRLFSELDLGYPRREFEIHDLLALICMIFFMIALQIVLVLNREHDSQAELVFKLATVSVVAVILYSRAWYLNRRFLIGALEGIFEQVRGLDYRKPQSSLALHTAPVLAEFERSYNLLTSRLRQSERELSSLVASESDRTRYRTMGEMSALIAHDLAGPLHAIQFCAEELSENPGSDAKQREEFLARIRGNTQRAVELINSLRARLKDSGGRAESVRFGEAHQHVLRLIQLQFRPVEFNRILFSLAPELRDLEIRISSVDLIHILENLLRNAVAELVRSQVPKPAISAGLVGAAPDQDGRVRIFIRDNGTGLDPERFERLTAHRFESAPATGRAQGLGLMLTRRLVELHGGELKLASTQEGTEFLLVLPLVQHVAEGVTSPAG